MQNTEKQTKKELFAEIVRFLIVGGCATVIDYLVFWLFDAQLLPLCFPQGGLANVSLTISTAAGFLAGLIFNWIFSVVFVFKRTREKIKISSMHAFGTFIFISVIGLFMSVLGMLVLVWALPNIYLFGCAQLFGTEWKKWIAKVVVTCVVLIFNYLARKRWIFKA